MLKSRLALVITLAVSTGSTLPSAHAQGRVTKDPNGAPRATAAPKAADPRLAQKVTYSSGQKRLHDVADDLTAMTGVKVRAGESAQDWRMRDIPLIVAVKDLPLERLLKAIAESTHTSLTSEKLPRTGELIYRFYRSRKDDIGEQLKAIHEKKLADAAWAWDAMVSLGKHPQALKGIKEPVETLPLVAQLVATLGPDARSRVLAGESVQVKANSTRLEIFRSLQTAYRSRFATPDQPAKELTQEDLESSVLTLKLRDGGTTGNVELYASLTPQCGYPFMCGFRMFSALLGFDKIKELNLPARPYVTDQMGGVEPPPAPGLELLALKLEPPLASLPGKEWSEPELTAKVTLPLPDKTTPTYADEITALAEATGYNIVTEDFVSHTCGFCKDMKDKFNHEAKACDMFNETRSTWFMDKNSKLLIGWAYNGGAWRNCHMNLVPESFVTQLAAKLNTGIELDDITPVASLTEGQRSDWVLNNEQTWWTLRGLGDIPVWQLYDALTPAEKALAKSESGLKLSSFDQASLRQFLKSAQETYQQAAFPDSGVPEIDTTQKPALKDILDPKVLSIAIMRVKSEPAYRYTEVDRGPMGDLVDKDGWTKWYSQLHTYYAEIDYTIDGNHRTARFEGPKLSFPVMSMKKFTKPVEGK